MTPHIPPSVLCELTRSCGDTVRLSDARHAACPVETSSPANSVRGDHHRVVELVAEGLSQPQIAERMFIARGTVKVHLARVFTKLEVTSRAPLAAMAATADAG